jgi:hypothetical protein
MPNIASESGDGMPKKADIDQFSIAIKRDWDAVFRLQPLNFSHSF